MPWHVSQSAHCPASRPWAVIKDSDGSVVACHPSKQAADDHMAAMYANEPAAAAFPFAAPIGEAMAIEHRTAPLEEVEVKDSNQGDGRFTIRGHAAVFNRWSLDLGGFREKIAKGAFQAVLDRNPDVHAVWDHDTAKVLARTRGGSLELREDPAGLHMWARVADTSYSRDLRVLMENGLVDQASFAFTVAPGGDEWKFFSESGEEKAERTIHEIGELYDVTVTAQGAYPTASTEVVMRALRESVERQVELGKLSEAVLARFDVKPRAAIFAGPQTFTSGGNTVTSTMTFSGAEPSVAPVLVGGTVPHLSVETEEATLPAPETAEEEAQRKRALENLRNLAAGETALAKEKRSEFSRRRYRLSGDTDKETGT